MGLLSNQMRAGAAGAAGGGGDFYDYQIPKSFRWTDGAAYLKRTPSAAGNRQTWTFSCWMKASGVNKNTSGDVQILNVGSSGHQDTRFRMYFYNQKLYSSSNEANYNTSPGVYRDSSAWYHVVWKLTGGTSYQYVNGTLASSVSVSGDVAINNNVEHVLGISHNGSTSNKFKGYFAEVVFIDGTALDPTSFAESKNGVWIPKDPSTLTFGSQGYHLDFADASAPGNDVSGNNNDWTNVSLATHDQMLDSPTFGSSNGGNFATLGPLWKNPSQLTLSEGNLRGTTSTNNIGAMSNWAVPASGKWYWEVNYSDQYSSGTSMYVGIAYANTSLTAGETADQVVYYTENGMKIVEGTRTAGYGSGFDSPSGDAVIGVAVDRVNNTLNFSYNGTWQGTIDISGLSSDEFFPFTMPTGVNGTQGYTYNFGQDGTFSGKFVAGGNADDNGYGNFKYAVPTGFLAMCAANLPTAAEVDPAQTDDNYPQKLFSAKTYTGTGSSNAITGLGFQPDWVWIKKRNGTTNHSLFDSSRGTGKYIATNNSNDEGTDSATLNAFGSDGFTVVSDTTVNASSDTYVAWNWRANGGTTSTNTSGSVDSTVQVDPSGAFSVVTWAGGGGNATLGHGLSGAPTFMAAKSRTSGAPVMDWPAFHKNMNNGAFPANESRMYWSDAGGYGAGALWQTANNSASLFGVTYNINDSGKNYVAYCFTDVEGYCKADYYVGNGNADGPFVYTGFRPAYIWYKATSASESWVLIDNARNPFNVSAKALGIEDTWAESDSTVTYGLDILSNGFKVRGTNAVINSNGSAYIYLAMAHNPFKYATAR